MAEMASRADMISGPCTTSELEPEHGVWVNQLAVASCYHDTTTSRVANEAEVCTDLVSYISLSRIQLIQLGREHLPKTSNERLTQGLDLQARINQLRDLSQSP